MQHDRQKFEKGVDEEVNWSHQGNTFHDEPFYWTDDDVISKLGQHFSSMSTMNRAREELKDLKHLPSQPISSYMYKYGRIHFLTTGNQAQNERYPTAFMEFIESLNPKIIRALAKKHADPRTSPRCCNKPSTWQKKYEEEYWRLNPLKGAAQYDFQAQ